MSASSQCDLHLTMLRSGEIDVRTVDRSVWVAHVLDIGQSYTEVDYLQCGRV